MHQAPSPAVILLLDVITHRGLLRSAAIITQRGLHRSAAIITHRGIHRINVVVGNAGFSRRVEPAVVQRCQSIATEPRKYRSLKQSPARTFAFGTL